MFPLPLTPFEQYYWLDDRPEFPTTFPVELLFDGELDRASFERALAQSAARHPLLTAHLDESGVRPCWIQPPNAAIRCDWAAADVPIEHAAGEYIDLRQEPGLRCWVRVGSGHSRLLFEFHHACCDGLAALLFAQDVLACYKREALHDESSAVLREVDAAELLKRGEFVDAGARRPSLIAPVQDLYITFSLWRRILFRSPVAIAAPRKTQPANHARPGLLAFESETLSVEETARLHLLAGSLAVTTNDLLLRDLFLVLADWNERQTGTRPGRLRVNMPVSIRRRDEKTMPASNRIGFGFVTCESGQAADPAKLLSRMRQQTQRIKDWKLALYFLGGVSLAAGRPGILRWALQRDRSLASMVASNVGRFVPEWGSRSNEAWQCGALTLTRVTGVPPLRPLTRAAAILIEYAGRLTISLRCDPTLFNSEQTRSLLDAYIARIRRTLAKQ